MNCTLCPRKCKIDRKTNFGFCKAGPLPTVAKVMLHKWEEPCICYEKGSGAVFFSGCQLQCVFCQNHSISSEICGSIYDRTSLCRLFFRLEEEGACNINLVSPTPHLNEVIPALREAKKNGLKIPVLFNSGGYEDTDTIGRLEGLVDIFMPDFKFFHPDLALACASAKDYPEVALETIGAMFKQRGVPVWKEDRLLSGVLIRHLVLPNYSKDSCRIIELLAENFKPDHIVLSLMRQYTPMHKAKEIPLLSRTVTRLEYSRVVKCAEEKGFKYLYTQKKESATEDFVPDFFRTETDFS